MSTINMTVESSVDALIGVVLKHRPNFSARDQIVLKAAILASRQPEELLADLRKAYQKKTLGQAIDRILGKDYDLRKPEPKSKPSCPIQTRVLGHVPTKAHAFVRWLVSNSLASWRELDGYTPCDLLKVLRDAYRDNRTDLTVPAIA